MRLCAPRFDPPPETAGGGSCAIASTRVAGAMSWQEQSVRGGVAWVNVICCPRVVHPCPFATYPASGGGLSHHLGSSCVVASIVRSVWLGSLSLPGGLAGVAASWIGGESVAGEAGAVDGHRGATRGGRGGLGWCRLGCCDWGYLCLVPLAREPPPPYRGVGWFRCARWVSEGGSRVVPFSVPVLILG